MSYTVQEFTAEVNAVVAAYEAIKATGLFTIAQHAAIAFLKFAFKKNTPTAPVTAAA